ncbi:MAG: TetR/AcrR family transcriptional regulator [Desulfobacterales bacterium]|jgi:AcrR family transcriptional regulator
MKLTRKEHILKYATVLFANKGYAESTTLELSEVCGVASGTIFYHFGTKEGLFLAILEDIRQAIDMEFEQYFDGLTFSSGLQMLEEIIAFYLYMASKYEAQFMLLQRPHTNKMANTNHECRVHLEAIFNRLVDIFEKTILRGQQDGSIADLPVRKTALILFSMVDGFVRFKNNNFYDAGALFNELVTLCQRMLENRKTETGTWTDR